MCLRTTHGWSTALPSRHGPAGIRIRGSTSKHQGSRSESVSASDSSAASGGVGTTGVVTGDIVRSSSTTGRTYLTTPSSIEIASTTGTLFLTRMQVSTMVPTASQRTHGSRECAQDLSTVLTTLALRTASMEAAAEGDRADWAQRWASALCSAVELERARPHGVLDACAFDAHVKAVAHLDLALFNAPAFWRI